MVIAAQSPTPAAVIEPPGESAPPSPAPLRGAACPPRPTGLVAGPESLRSRRGRRPDTAYRLDRRRAGHRQSPCWAEARAPAAGPPAAPAAGTAHPPRGDMAP